MATGTVARQDIVAMLEELPNDLLPEVVRFLQALKPRAISTRSAQEEALLETARKRLPPATERRLHDLRALHEEGRISSEERTELLALIDRVEQEDAERAAAIVALARLRGVPVSEVLRELSPERAADAG